MEVEEAEVVQAIWAQNQRVRDSLTETELRAEIYHLHAYPRPRSQTANWVIETSPRVRHVIRQGRSLYIGWTRCRTLDYVRATRCFHCLDLGHTAKHCPSTTASCTHCGQDHTKAACPNTAVDPRCAPCRRRHLPDTHEFDHDSCPTYKSALEKVLKNTDYGV